ncbi:hypothetical protein JMUB3935_2408 [Leptotrichia trevisanii]|uniref:Uncharacterized protein n=1 Tax=Leptotrichia trevisanii TaxID=109328 RepID=A0A510K4N6_9FUSO|nr:hypothetical protein [Leptotrichia trevisanii]BBM46167.1 hypothetical protein JMUB3870_2300 [Leptotrichia trevisanii]BBM53415.1 hypothetical protein JMUB3935_2408 [Leptotrichia trevisanii]
MLQNFYGVIQVKHYQNGRLRLQTDILRENVELEQEFLNNMRQLSGIDSVRVNSVTGSILIYFDEKIIESSFLYLIVLKLLHLEGEALKNKPGKIKVLLKQTFEAVDMAIYNKSKGYLDLKTLVAGIFAFYGIKKLRKFPELPAGATLLWWTFIFLSEGKRK